MAKVSFEGRVAKLPCVKSIKALGVKELIS